ncbi:hypothetical protein [Levilactobacillus parabrevis]|uniref:hypothetical protein n=1 Tax=Levilactobacillus parabrevis TaxID=357278 RepID=UPI003756C0CA
MSKLLHPTLNILFKVAFLDFYVFLAAGVCAIVQVPDHILFTIWTAVAVIFVLSVLLTLSGIIFAQLYREMEAISIFVLQAGLSILLLTMVL